MMANQAAPAVSECAASRGEFFAHLEDWSERRRGRPATDDEGRSLEAGRRLLHPGLPERAGQAEAVLCRGH